MLKLLFPINRWSVLGFFLLVLGFFLTPFLIGLLIMPVGAVLLCFGALYSLFGLLPGHRQKEEAIKVFLRQYVDSSPLLKTLLRKNSKPL